MENQTIAHKIIAVGIGPGAADYVIPAARRAIDEAKVLVGSRRALASYDNGHCATCPITGDLPRVMAFIRAHLQQTDVVVMLSGDPGYYSLLAALRREFTAKALTVIPGISSMQLAFARLALPWQDAVITSMHGREPDAKQLRYRAGKTLGLLTDAVYTSRSTAAYLLRLGWPERCLAYALARLSYEDERILSADLAQLAKMDEIKHCILVVIG